jgi:hypothetical protein
MTLRLSFAALAATLACALPAAASSQHCPVPSTNVATWTALHESGIGCPAAKTLGEHYFRNGHLSGWACTHRLAGTRGVTFSCRNSQDSRQTLSGSWHVH